MLLDDLVLELLHIARKNKDNNMIRTLRIIITTISSIISKDKTNSQSNKMCISVADKQTCRVKQRTAHTKGSPRLPKHILSGISFNTNANTEFSNLTQKLMSKFGLKCKIKEYDGNVANILRQSFTCAFLLF